MHCLKISLVLPHLLLTTIGAINLTCDIVDPRVQSDVTCVCKRTSGSGVDWFFDDVFHSNCLLNSICVPQYSGYKYTINSTENVYEITINSYNYNDCKKVSCKDVADVSIERSTVPSSIKFDATYPTSMTEPATNNQNGVISVTTGCISGFSNVEYKWYIIVDGSEEEYTPDQINSTDTFTCSNCNTDHNGQRTIGFNHQEVYGSGTKNVSFRVILSHASTNEQLNITSSHVYSVRVNAVNNDKVSDGGLKTSEKVGIALASIVFAAVLILLIYFCCRKAKTGSKNQLKSVTNDQLTATVQAKQRKVIIQDEDMNPSGEECIIQWTVPSNLSDANNRYMLEYCLFEGNHWTKQGIILKETRTRLRSLQPETSYKIRVYVIYQSEVLEPPGENLFETTEEDKFMPRYVANSNKSNHNQASELQWTITSANKESSSTCYDIQWTVDEFERGNKLTYMLEYSLANKNDWIKRGIFKKGNFRLESLQPGAHYKVRVYAINQSKILEPPGEYQFRTPLILQIKTVEPSTEECRITWTVQDIPDGSNVIEYLLEYCLSDWEIWTKHGSILTNTETRLQSLHSGMSYKIRVYPIYQLTMFEPPGESSFKTEPLDDRFINRPLDVPKHLPVSAPHKLRWNIESDTYNSSTEDIKWTVETLHGTCAKLKYMLEYSLKVHVWIKHGEMLIEGNARLESLQPNTSYKIRVYAISESDVIEPPGEYTFRTKRF